MGKKETFVSRIDGTVKKRSEHKDLSQMPPEEFREALSKVGRLIEMNNFIDPIKVTMLAAGWRVPRKRIEKILELMDGSLDASHKVLDLMDSESVSMKRAIEMYQEENGCSIEIKG